MDKIIKDKFLQLVRKNHRLVVGVFDSNIVENIDEILDVLNEVSSLRRAVWCSHIKREVNEEWKKERKWEMITYKNSINMLGRGWNVVVLEEFEKMSANVMVRCIETVIGKGVLILGLSKNNGCLFSRRLLNLLSCNECAIFLDSDLNVIQMKSKNIMINSDTVESVNVYVNESVNDTNNDTVNDTNNDTVNDSNNDSNNDTVNESVNDSNNIYVNELTKVPDVLSLCKTNDQYETLNKLIRTVDNPGLEAVLIDANRGRGKSSILGLGIAYAVSRGIRETVVCGIDLVNVQRVFKGAVDGLEKMGYKCEQKITNNGKNKMIFGVEVRSEEAVIRFKELKDVRNRNKNDLNEFKNGNYRLNGKLNDKLVVIDETACLPLEIIKNILKKITESKIFLASTSGGYEGTGQAFGTKLQEFLISTFRNKIVFCVMEEPVRYGMGDNLERWVNDGFLLNTKMVNKDSKLEFRDSKLERRDSKLERRDSKLELRDSKLELRDSKLERRDSKLELRDSKLERRDSKLELRDSKLELKDSKLERRDSKLELRDSKLERRDSKLELRDSKFDTPEQCLFIHGNKEKLFGGDERCLRELWGVLSTAHYRNSPDDLQTIANTVGHEIYWLADKHGAIICIIHAAIEGGLEPDAVQGSGNLLPWVLSETFCDPEMLGLHYLRIVRIAVNPRAMSQGYGTEALKRLGELILEPKYKNIKPINYIGVSFGLGPKILRFWRRSGYIAVCVRQDCSRSTGEHSAVLLRSVSDSGKSLLHKLHMKFVPRFLSLLAYSFCTLSPTLALALLQPISEDKTNIGTSQKNIRGFSDDEIFRLKLFAKGLTNVRNVIDTFSAVARYFFSNKNTKSLSVLHQSVLLMIACQKRSIEDVVEEISLRYEQVVQILHELIIVIINC